jgi:hypothetical protein
MKKLLILLLLAPSVAGAIQFTATAVMSRPGQADVTTQLAYSTGRIRKEFFYYGEPVVEIVDARTDTSLMCFTEQQVCYESKSPTDIDIGIEKRLETPCDGAGEGLICNRVGEEQINGRDTVKWKIVAKEGDKELVSWTWMDKALKIPVRQKLFNGTDIELKWLGSEQLDNRDTDRWLRRITYPDGRSEESRLWFDKELNIIIREDFANGGSRVLKHIVVENLPDKLFTIPAGYEKRSLSAPGGRQKP